MTSDTQDRRETIAAIDFGMEVEAFLQGRIGRYLVGRAEAEAEAAVEGLKTVSPTEPETIRVLQNAVARAESVQYWLAEAIQAGHNAQRELEGEE